MVDGLWVDGFTEVVSTCSILCGRVIMTSGGWGKIKLKLTTDPSIFPLQTRNIRRHSCHSCKGIGGDTECPLQVCRMSRSSESTHFLCLRTDVALFDSTRAPDGF